tara:strand:- start:22184 stop:22396 length:213 start_codon:yes stop_codon:yes gene_type:complete
VGDQPFKDSVFMKAKRDDKLDWTFGVCVNTLHRQENDAEHNWHFGDDAKRDGAVLRLALQKIPFGFTLSI